MNPAPLSMLRDIHLPPSISWWPPAPGWFILLGLAVLVFCYLIYRRIKSRHRRKMRKAALKRLKHYTKTYENDKASTSDAQMIAELSILIRQLAVLKHSDQKIAGLHGQHWLKFLDETAKTKAFTKGEGQLLQHGPYQPSSTSDLTPLFKLIRRWIRMNT